ncbi:mariner Mos1 transposase [Trichonephila clavipes]|uniref:Mariner Mos1 transposase n=1 Tax=Trichonephila clavipes TaxID=2585209 RepID=A0A8X6W0U0_TRICX|nr:mariner Mos1 transposase [Trichonephila clavipes]
MSTSAPFNLIHLLKLNGSVKIGFAKFRSGDFSLKDEKRSGRPVEVDDDLIKAIIDLDRYSKTRESWSRPGEPTQTLSKSDIHQKKVLLSVWWDYKEIVYFELLPPNRTINSDVYIEQLTKLNNAFEEKWPELTNRKGVEFHQGNARPHTSLVTRQKLLKLGWDLLPHPPYSPDLAPSDYFLFRSLQNSLNGKNFNSDDDVKSYLIQFFANQNQKFYERGIMMLPERWQKVIDQNGEYITE